MFTPRAIVVSVLIVAAALAAREPAHAFQYCPVAVDAVQALQFGASDAYRRAVDRRFGVELQLAQPRTASVELSMAAGGDIYRVTFPGLGFTGSDRAIVFFSFPHPKSVDYLWVSRVAEPQRDRSCPLDPFHASHDYFNDRTLSQADLGTRAAANARILAAARADAVSHPEFVARIHRDCPTPDQTPTLQHQVLPDGGDLRSLKGPTPVVAVVHVSPTGEPLDAELLQSSSLANLDSAVLASARASTYNPATIDCMPSTGTYLFKALFGT